MRPLVSIGFPVYNGEPFLQEALDSLVNQTFRDFEVILCDNASTDRTADICQGIASRDPRFRYVRNSRNIGGPRNHNLTFRLAKGRYFKWAAADDVCLPRFLEACVDVLERDPGVVAAYPRIEAIDAKGASAGLRPADAFGTEPSPAPRLGAFLQKVALMECVLGVMRVKAVEATSLMRSYPSSDVTFIGELLLQGRLHQIGEVLFRRRDHSRNTRFLSPEDKGRWINPAGPARAMQFRSTRFLTDLFFSVARCRELSPTEKVQCWLALRHWAIRRTRNRVGVWRRKVLCSLGLAGQGTR